MPVREFLESRKAREQKPEQAAEQYCSLFEEAPVAYHEIDREGVVQRVNRAVCALLGFEAEEILGQPVWEFLALEQRQSSREAVRGKISERQPLVPFHGEYVRRDGSRLTLEIHENLIRDAAGNLVGIGSVLLDITERRRLEEQLRQSQKMQAIGLLAGGAAHDFNNAIGAIWGWTELALKEAAAGNPLRKYFQKIQHQAQHAAGLTRQLLAFASHQVSQPCRVNLNEIVASVVGLLESALGQRIQVKTKLAPTLEETWADPAELEQVLMNLCLNARDAMAGGGRLRIETRNVDFAGDDGRRHIHARPGRYVLLSVSDTGVGMDATTTKRMFQPFFTTKEAGRASGLGLAIVHGIVQQHDGFIYAQSQPGRGTTFRLYFPAAGAAPALKQKKRQPELPLGGTETILVAEDHEAAREVARETLASLGYQVLLTRDGEEAVRLMEAQRDLIGLVILDLLLPKLSGTEACAHMRALRPGLPVIFTTGRSAQTTLRSEMGEPGKAVLEKPYSTEALARKVRELLDGARAGAGSAPDLRRRQ